MSINSVSSSLSSYSEESVPLAPTPPPAPAPLPPPPAPAPPVKPPTTRELTTLVMALSPGLSRIVAAGSEALGELIMEQLVEAAKEEAEELRRWFEEGQAEQGGAGRGGGRERERSPLVAATASLLSQARAVMLSRGGPLAGRAGGTAATATAAAATDDDVCNAAAVLVRCRRWVQALATDATPTGVASLLAAQPQLAACVAGNDPLAEALASDASLVSALRRAPGIGFAMVRLPALAEALAASNGRLAACLAASPQLAAAIAADPSLALAVSGGVAAPATAPVPPASTSSAPAANPAVNTRPGTRLSSDASNSGAGGIPWKVHASRLAGCALAECLVRDASLLAALTPALARVMARSPAVVELVAAEREGLVKALVANNAALALAVAEQPVLAQGLTGPMGEQMAAVLVASPRLCAALTVSPHLAELMADGSVLVQMLHSNVDLSDYLAGNRRGGGRLQNTQCAVQRKAVGAAWCGAGCHKNFPTSSTHVSLRIQATMYCRTPAPAPCPTPQAAATAVCALRQDHGASPPQRPAPGPVQDAVPEPGPAQVTTAAGHGGTAGHGRQRHRG